MGHLEHAFINAMRDGTIKLATATIYDDKVHNEAEHHEDYGFATNPSEGNGITLTIGGITIVLRVNRSEGRPTLAADEVAVWHKDGHIIHLKADSLTLQHKEGHKLELLAGGKANIQSTTLTHNGVNIGATHTHSGVRAGSASTGVAQ